MRMRHRIAALTVVGLVGVAGMQATAQAASAPTTKPASPGKANAPGAYDPRTGGHMISEVDFSLGGVVLLRAHTAAKPAGRGLLGPGWQADFGIVNDRLTDNAGRYRITDSSGTEYKDSDKLTRKITKKGRHLVERQFKGFERTWVKSGGHWMVSTINTGSGATQIVRDRQDRITRVTNKSDTVRLKYDARGLLTRISGKKTVGYRYDSSGRLTSVRRLGKQTLYGYDSANRVKRITSPDEGTWTLGYSSAGKLAGQHQLKAGPASCRSAKDFMWDEPGIGCKPNAVVHYELYPTRRKQAGVIPKHIVGIEHDQCTGPLGFPLPPPQFSPACDMHDMGYGLVASGFLPNASEEEAKASKDQVDSVFYETLRVFSCVPGQGWCQALATSFYEAVKRGGDPNNGRIGPPAIPHPADAWAWLDNELPVLTPPPDDPYKRREFMDGSKPWTTHDSKYGTDCNTRQIRLLEDGKYRYGHTGKVQANVNYDECKPTASLSDPVNIGEWYSTYDKLVNKINIFNSGTELRKTHIDHIVPLKYAWNFGAWRWDKSKRIKFANDLAAPQLISVSGSSNSSKQDKGPEDWRPTNDLYHCSYARAWIGTKKHYDMSVRENEKDILFKMLDTCLQR